MGARTQRLRVTALALALLLAVPVWIAARSGLSGLYARPAIDYLQDKRAENYTLTNAQWQAVHHSIAQARQLMPDNPRYLSTMGALEQLRLSTLAGQPQLTPASASSATAIGYFRGAIEQRPTRAAYWGNLALEYRRSEQVDTPQYSTALINAARFGRWQNDIQRLVTDLGVEALATLTPDAREAVLQNVERGLHRQPPIILGMVGELGAWPALCRAHAEQTSQTRPHLAALCGQLERRGAAAT